MGVAFDESEKFISANQPVFSEMNKIFSFDAFKAKPENVTLVETLKKNNINKLTGKPILEYTDEQRNNKIDNFLKHKFIAQNAVNKYIADIQKAKASGKNNDEISKEFENTKKELTKQITDFNKTSINL